MSARVTKKKAVRKPTRKPGVAAPPPPRPSPGLPAPWSKPRTVPPIEFFDVASRRVDREHLAGAWKVDTDNPRCYVDDPLWLNTGSCVPRQYVSQDEVRKDTAELVAYLALAEVPIDKIVEVLRQKRREYGDHVASVCAGFITEEMVRRQFSYELDVFPYEAQAMVASSVLAQARGGNPKALELLVANKLPWTTQTGAPPSAKEPFRVTGDLRIMRDKAIAEAHADTEGAEGA